MSDGHFPQKLFLAGCRIARGWKPTQAVQHAERMDVQRHALVDAFDSMENQRGAFPTNPTDLRERLNGISDVAAVFYEMLCPSNQVFRFVATMRNARQMRHDCVDRRNASAVGRGKCGKELRQDSVDDCVGTIRRQNHSSSDFPRPVRTCQHVQRMSQTDVLRIFFDSPELFLHLEYPVFREAGQRGHIMGV